MPLKTGQCDGMVYDSFDNAVCEVAAGRTAEQACQLAALIVQALNSYAALLKVAEAVKDYHDAKIAFSSGKQTVQDVKAAYGVVRDRMAALDRVQKGE